MKTRTVWLVAIIVSCAACGGGGGGGGGSSTSSGGTGGNTGGTGGNTGGTGGNTGGTGGGGGSTPPPALTADQIFAENTAIAVTESTKQIVSGDQSAFLAIAAVVDSPSIVDLLRDALLENMPTPETIRELPVSVITSASIPFSDAGDCGGTFAGTLTVTGDDATPFPFDSEKTGTLSNFCIPVPPYTVTYNGDVSISTHWQSLVVYDFTLTLDVSYTSTIPDGPATGSIDIDQSCSIASGSSTQECTYATTFQGDDAFYTISDVQVSGNDSAGFSVTGVFVDDVGNDYTFEATLITFCLSGNVQSGQIDVTVNGGDVINISYPSCSDMIVTYKGDSRTVAQSP